MATRRHIADPGRMKQPRESLGTERRFLILQRDAFTCAFCGAKPGNDRLHVDHLIPFSKGGSDHDNNLATACDRCNHGKKTNIAIPLSMCTSDPVLDGWITWKRWGDWHLMFIADGDGGNCVLTFQPGKRDYWIAYDRFHEQDWHDHLSWKPFMHDDYEAREAREDAERAAQAAKGETFRLFDVSSWLDEPVEEMKQERACGKRWVDFCDAIAFARTLTRDESQRGRRKAGPEVRSATWVADEARRALGRSDEERQLALELANGRSATDESPGAFCIRCGRPTGFDAVAEIDLDRSTGTGFEVRHVDRAKCLLVDDPGGPPR